MTDFFVMAVQTAREVFVPKPHVEPDETPEQRHQRILREQIDELLDRQESRR